MEKNNNGYKQCYWHANGNLVCNNLKTKYQENTQQNYIEFDNFSTPNKNYDPNGYRKHLKYYESANNYSCNVPCGKCKKNQINNYEWMSPQQTIDKKNFLLGTDLKDISNNYYPSNQ